MSKYLTTTEVAVLTGRHPQTVQAAARKHVASRGRKGLRSFRKGHLGDYRFLEADVDKWMQGP